MIERRDYLMKLSMSTLLVIALLSRTPRILPRGVR